MMTLIEALKLFNRAEPDLLLRDAFDTRDRPLVINQNFMQRVCDKLNLELFEPQFWAFEYTFNALAGALYLYVMGDSVLSSDSKPLRTPQDLPQRKNPKQENSPYRFKNKKPGATMRLVEGGREDFDLVILTGTTLILIEAKIYSNNDDSQVGSKNARLRLLKEFCEGLPGWPQRQMTFRTLLATRNGGGSVMRLQVPCDKVYRTERCDSSGKKSKDGDYMHIVSGQ